MVAKACRFLRAVLNTAVKEDEMIRVNPCRGPIGRNRPSGRF
jgi:hypothetical protein